MIVQVALFVREQVETDKKPQTMNDETKDRAAHGTAIGEDVSPQHGDGKKRAHENVGDNAENGEADAKKPKLDNGHSLDKNSEAPSDDAAVSSEEKMVVEELNDGDEAKLDEPLVVETAKEKETKRVWKPN